MPDAPSISHETIYAAIYAMPRGALRTELVRTLRKSHAGRLPRARGSSRFTGVQNMTPIGLRPPEVDQRLAPGHWEADLIKGSFESLRIPKHKRRFTGFDDKMVAMHARGVTVREVQAFLAEQYSTEVSPEFISSLTDAVMSEVTTWQAWQARPLEPM